MRKTVVIIPSYEPPWQFVNYVQELSTQNINSIIIVNDGSDGRFDGIYGKISLIKKCHVLQYSKNKGKGYALKHAFLYCKEKFNDDYIFITADCDGQHRVKDVIKIRDASLTSSDKLFLGARNFNSDSVPLRSRFGNIFTRSIFNLMYRLSLSDTQTGLRAFSYALLEKLLSISGNRFEYEMNMLINLKRIGIEIIEIPIETVYIKQDDTKNSHFKPIADSLKIFAVLLKNLGKYFTVSIISAASDILLFYFFIKFLFFRLPPHIATLISTVTARIISSVINLTFNFKYVFYGNGKGAIKRYYCLWTIQLMLSYLLTALWSNIIGTENAVAIALAKGTSDIILAFISYQIQMRWVFTKPVPSRLSFFGAFFKASRAIVNLFIPKYKSYLSAPETGTVYLCRHLNMKGPFRVAQSLGFDVHFMVLNCFCDFKSCYRQYRDYTFSKRHGCAPTIITRIKAFFSALYVVPLIRSSKPIKVFRGGGDSVLTIKQSSEHLMRGESIMIFPDIDYRADKNSYSDIYKGFLLIDKLVYSKEGKHPSFTVIYVDDDSKSIYASDSVRFSGAIPFSDELPMVATKLKALLMRNAVK